MAKLVSIQSGTVNFGSFDTDVSVIVDSYDLTKSILLWRHNNLCAQPSDYNIMVVKVSDTIILFTRSLSTEQASIYWVLLSFSSGVAVQNILNSTDCLAVDLSKAFVICSGILVDPINFTDQCCAKLISPTSISPQYIFDRYYLQVIEYDTCEITQLSEGVTTQEIVIVNCDATDDCKLCTWLDNHGTIQLQSLG
jgi:hypothetical protein